GRDGDLGALDSAAIERVRDEQRPDPRDADELHDTLLTTAFLTVEEAAAIDTALFGDLVAAKRIAQAAISGPARAVWTAVERLPARGPIHPPLHIEGAGGNSPARLSAP